MAVWFVSFDYFSFVTADWIVLGIVCTIAMAGVFDVNEFFFVDGFVDFVIGGWWALHPLQRVRPSLLSCEAAPNWRGGVAWHP